MRWSLGLLEESEPVRGNNRGIMFRPGVRLGKPSARPSNTAENKVFSNTPSSIPSSASRELENDLAVIVAAWPRIPAEVRTALLAAAIAGSRKR